MSAAPAISGNSVKVLDGFRGQLQAQDTWCWAAAAASVEDYFARRRNPPRKARAQCQFVKSQFIRNPCRLKWKKGTERRDCQINGCSTDCDNEYGWLNHALQTAHLYRAVEVGAISFSACTAEIDKGRPFGVRVEHGDGTDHIVVVIGYDAAVSNLIVWDPWYGQTSVSYNEWGAQLGAWTHTILTRK